MFEQQALGVCADVVLCAARVAAREGVPIVQYGVSRCGVTVEFHGEGARCQNTVSKHSANDSGLKDRSELVPSVELPSFWPVLHRQTAHPSATLCQPVSGDRGLGIHR